MSGRLEARCRLHMLTRALASSPCRKCRDTRQALHWLAPEAQVYPRQRLHTRAKEHRASQMASRPRTALRALRVVRVRVVAGWSGEGKPKGSKLVIAVPRNSTRKQEACSFGACSFVTSPVLVPVRASPVPSVVRGSFVVKFFCKAL